MINWETYWLLVHFFGVIIVLFSGNTTAMMGVIILEVGRYFYVREKNKGGDKVWGNLFYRK